MPNPLLARRVEVLEENVEALNELPERVARVETRLVTLHDELTALRAEIRAGDEETRREMRGLHEDVISRIALLQEGIDRRNGQRARSTRTRTPPKRRR